MAMESAEGPEVSGQEYFAGPTRTIPGVSGDQPTVSAVCRSKAMSLVK